MRSREVLMQPVLPFLRRKWEERKTNHERQWEEKLGKKWEALVQKKLSTAHEKNLFPRFTTARYNTLHGIFITIARHEDMWVVFFDKDKEVTPGDRLAIVVSEGSPLAVFQTISDPSGKSGEKDPNIWAQVVTPAVRKRIIEDKYVYFKDSPVYVRKFREDRWRGYSADVDRLASVIKENI